MGACEQPSGKTRGDGEKERIGKGFLPRKEE